MEADESNRIELKCRAVSWVYLPAAAMFLLGAVELHMSGHTHYRNLLILLAFLLPFISFWTKRRNSVSMAFDPAQKSLTLTRPWPHRRGVVMLDPGDRAATEVYNLRFRKLELWLKKKSGRDLMLAWVDESDEPGCASLVACMHFINARCR